MVGKHLSFVVVAVVFSFSFSRLIVLIVSVGFSFVSCRVWVCKNVCFVECE